MALDGERYDVVVVGGGHAGVEAAWAAAQAGVRVGLLTSNPERIGTMPCNPAVGGPGKSQLVAEIHALGGLMGRLADETAIHTRILNRSKGPAVQSLRVQVDRDAYATHARMKLLAHPGIVAIQGEAAELWVEEGRLRGVRTTDSRRLQADSVVIAAGTFLRGLLWYGRKSRPAGRQGEPPARYLSASLEALGHRMLRFKTGTPPRIRANSVKFAQLERIEPDMPAGSFSGQPGSGASSVATWTTRTNARTHELILDNLRLSPLYNGEISGIGPRYCPSIEDKVVRFSDRGTHLLFVEPDGLDTSELYLQGFSSSLPPELQEHLVHSLPGFEQAVIQRYAYAVEYDVVDPTELSPTLASRRLTGLYTAGQINGTSGYEEAAAQGLIAGLNAARYAAGQGEAMLLREGSYIGVMIDDLVHRGVDEPYRMMTSRVELRMLNRVDNADERLTPHAVQWGLQPPARLALVRAKYDRVNEELARLSRVFIDGVDALTYLRRGDTSHAALRNLRPIGSDLTPEEVTQVEIRARYAGYIKRQRTLRARLQDLETYMLGRHLKYTQVASLSAEAAEKLQRIAPRNLKEASRISGIRDSDLTALLVYLRISRRDHVGL